MVIDMTLEVIFIYPNPNTRSILSTQTTNYVMKSKTFCDIHINAMPMDFVAATNYFFHRPNHHTNCIVGSRVQAALNQQLLKRNSLRHVVYTPGYSRIVFVWWTIPKQVLVFVFTHRLSILRFMHIWPFYRSRTMYTYIFEVKVIFEILSVCR